VASPPETMPHEVSAEDPRELDITDEERVERFREAG
jgi:hypothetical protein